MTKKFIPLLTLLAIESTACSNFANVKVSGNVDVFLGIKTPAYQEPITANITANLELSIPFALYFTNEGCSSCEAFSPIADNYLNEAKFLTYKYDVNKDRDEFNKLIEKHGDLLFKENKESIVTPSYLIVDKDQNVYNINYNSYMKTESAFFNYMNTKFSLSNVYLTSGDVFTKNFINKEFVYIYFNFQNVSLFSLLKSNIISSAYNSNKPVIISNYSIDEYMHLSISGKNEKGQTYSRIKMRTKTNLTEQDLSKLFK